MKTTIFFILFFFGIFFRVFCAEEKPIGEQVFIPWKGNSVTQISTKQGVSIFATFSIRINPKGLVEIDEKKAFQVELLNEQGEVVSTVFADYSAPSTAKAERGKIKLEPPSKKRFDVTASFDTKKVKDGKYKVRISSISFYFSNKKEEWKPNGEGWEPLEIDYKKPVPKSKLDELQRP